MEPQAKMTEMLYLMDPLVEMTAQLLALEPPMETNVQVMVVRPNEEETGTVTERRKMKRRIEGEEDNPEESTRESSFVSAKAQAVLEKEIKERGFVCKRGFGKLISPFQEVIEKRG